jgi:hypothetical protein
MIRVQEQKPLLKTLEAISKPLFHWFAAFEKR